MDIQYRRELGKLLEHFGIMGPAAEIGVAEGRFSLELLQMGIPKLYMVDVWDHIPGQPGDGSSPKEWHQSNLDKALNAVWDYAEGKLAQVIFVQLFSVEAAKRVDDESLSLVYIDADHSFEGCRADIAAWYPKLIEGGIMAFHDYEMPQYGVKDAVDYICFGIGVEVHKIPEDKPEDAGAWFQKPKWNADTF